jgi:hypothetical protein
MALGSTTLAEASMRVVVLLLTVFILLGGCAREAEVAYVDLPSRLPQSHASARRPALASAQTLADSEPSMQQRDSRSMSSEHQWNTRILPASVQNTGTLFDSVEAKAETVGVENLTQADIKGLSYDQIRKLRGY